MAELASSLQIGSMTLKNRTFMAPISLGHESKDGSPSEVQQAYWLERAKGGVGCLILDATTVDPATPYLGNTLCFRDEEVIAKHKAFTDKVHEYGAKVIPQITHPGPESISSFFGVPPMAPSEYRNSMYQQARALAKEELPAIVNMYAEASLHAKEAGYDGIELHSAHGYMLLGAFLSPLRNKRDDEYGGSLMNRARLLIEVIDAIKAKCGKEFPIVLRISGDEKLPGGNTVEDIKTLVPILIEHGIDAFEISGGAQYEMPNKIMPSHGEPQAVNLEQAMAIKEVSSVPVITVGKINTPELARTLIEEDKVDGLVIGRALLADSEFVSKTIEHRDEDISPCVSCLVGCVGQQSKRLPGSCAINPFVGREAIWQITPAENPKKVAIIGGGIGGMAAAKVLAQRGHKVDIYEKSNKLGGQINLACIPPHKEDLAKWIIYLETQLKKLNVTVHLGEEMDAAKVNALDCDEIIVATGSNPMALSEGENVCTAHAFLNGDVKIPSGKVLVVGGGMVGMETAETLFARKEGDLSVVIIEMASAIGAGLAPANLVPAMGRLKQLDVTMMCETKLVKFDGSNADVEVKEESQTLEGFTHVIYAVGSKENAGLYEAIKDCGKTIHIIGDAHKVGQALDAVAEGTEVALQI